MATVIQAPRRVCGPRPAIVVKQAGPVRKSPDTIQSGGPFHEDVSEDRRWSLARRRGLGGGSDLLAGPAEAGLASPFDRTGGDHASPSGPRKVPRRERF